jgi:hypothetical protein
MYMGKEKILQKYFQKGGFENKTSTFFFTSEYKPRENEYRNTHKNMNNFIELRNPIR